MTEAELNWLAGFLEGEASFTIEKHRYEKKTYLYPAISVTSTDYDVLERASRLLGAPNVWKQTKKNVKCKPCFQTRVRNDKALSVMREILPLMGERRRRKIEEIVSSS